MKTLHTIYSTFAKHNMASLRLLLVMFLTLTVSANAWAEEGEATITFSNAGLSNQQSVNGTSFALGDYFTVTYAKNGSSTNPTYYTSGTAIRCYVTKSTSNGNTITINQTENGKDVNAYITSVTYSGTNKQGTTSFAYSGTPTSSSNYSVAYSDASKVTSVVATLKETGGSKNGQFYSTGITITYTYTAGGGDPVDPYIVTLMPGSGSVTDTELEEPNAGEGVTLPTPTLDCGDWKFAGWAEASVGAETQSKPTLIAAGTYKPASNITLYAVYQRTEKTEGNGGTENVSRSYTFSNYSVGTQYAEETHALDENVTISIQNCHLNTQLRIYSSASNNGTVISNELPGRIVSMGFNMGYKADALVVYGSTNGSSWTEVGKISTTTSYKDYTLDFGEKNYTYFKLDVEGTSQIRVASMSITWESTSAGGSTSTTYYHSVPDCDPCNALQAPNVTAKNITTNSFTLLWAAVPGATSYNIYNYTTEETDEITDLTYTFNGLDPNTEYEWEVEAVSATCNGKGTTGTTTTLKTYTITWKNADGTVLETDENVPHGTTPTYNGATPTKTATAQYTYTFSDWSPTIYAADKDQVYTAQFSETLRQYTVTFNANGHGTAPDAQEVDYNKKATEPSAPTATGYTFGGWYKESGCTNAWNFATDVVTGNVTLYAKWTEKPLTNYRTDCDACIPLDGYAEINGTYHFFPGETIIMTVTPPENAVSYTYQWQKLVVSDWDNLEGATTTTYTKTEATIEDVGHYRCVVSAEGYCDAIAEYNVKCLQLNVYYDDHTLAFTTPLEKVDATTAMKSVNLENANYKYYFEITDGCENFYGFNGDIHSGWYENVELNAMNSSKLCGLQTTKFGTYIFTVDHSYLTDDNKSYPVVTVMYPASLQEADKVIYLDNDVLKWTNSDNAEGKNKIYYRIGRENHNSKTAMTLVPGTANLYKVTTSEYNNFEVWHIANNGCWSEDNPIYKTNTDDDWAATQATAFETLPVTLESVTVTPTTSIGNGGEDRNSNCEFFNYDITEGMKTWNAEVIEPTNGTITVKYTHHDGTAVNDFTSGTRDLAHTCLLTITATADEGYSLTSLTVNDDPFTSGNVHTLTADAVIKAIFTINTHVLTWDVNEGNPLTGEYTQGSVDYGTPIVQPADPTRAGHTFKGWHDGTDIVTPATTMPDKDLTYTAQWQINQYTVTLNPNYPAGKTGTFTYEEGELVDGNLVLTYDYNTASKTIAALYTSLTLDGYEFGGWYNAKGSNPGQVSGSKCTTTGDITGNKTYFAKWSKLYTITLYENGTTTTPTTQTSTSYTLPTELSVGTCENDEKELVGWSTVAIPNPGDKPTSNFYELGATVTLTEDQTTFYAVFATVGEGGVDNTDYSNVHTSNVTLTNEGGTNATNSKVKISEVDYTAVKAGTGSASGAVKITVPAGTTKLSFHIAGWNKEGGKTISLTGATATPSSFTTVADAGVSGSSTTYTLSGTIADYFYSTTLSNIDEKTTLTFSNGGADQRFVIWGVNASTGGGTSYSEYTTTCVKLPDPVLSFATEPANPIVFTDAVCGGNSSKQSVTVVGENLRDVVNVSVTGPYKIARTASTALKDFTTSLTLDKTAAGAIHSNYQTVYIISTPPAQSTEATAGTLTFTTTKGNTLTVNLSTPTVTCTQYTLTLVDRGVSTEQPTKYYAGETIDEAPADPEGVCTDPIHYVFDGWAEATVAEGSTAYTKVTFPYTVTGNTKFYAVYRYVEEGSADSGDYVKVTEDLDDYSGDYLIVYEAGGLALNGALEGDNLDASGNSISVTITNNTIVATDEVNASNFTIAKENDDEYSIRSASGYYIGQSTNANDLKTNSTEYYANTITLSNDDNADVVSSGAYLRYNAATGNTNLRFRYYKSDSYTSQKAIALYRKAASYLYTTSPVCGPHLVITEGKEIYVTGGNAGGTRDLVIAQQKVSYKATRLKTSNGLADGTAPDVKVATNGITVGGVVTSDVKVAIDQIKELQADGTYTIAGTITVQYQPSANNKQEDIQVQLAVDYNSEARDNFTVHARSLPAEFVIVAKSGDKWYALNGDMNNGSSANPANGQVTLDDDANPTKATYAPCNTIYTFDGVPNTGDRTRVRFQGTDGAWLWAASGTNVGIQNKSLKDTPEGDNKAYNWKLETEDNITYKFHNDNSSRLLGLSGEKFGMYASAVQELRILPYVEKCLYNYAPSNLIVKELKGSYVVLTWDAVVGATKYQYSTNATTWTDAGTEPTVTINGLEGDTEYIYYIRAYHEDAGVSQECIDYAEITFTTADCDDVPTNITYTADLNSITVSWTAAAPTATIKLFMNEDGTGGGGTYPGATSPYTISGGLDKNTTYYIQILSDGTCASPIIPVKTEDVEVDIVEWKTDGIVVDINTNETVGVTLENEVSYGSGLGTEATELFFSKYYEASYNVKLVAIYNGTKNIIDLTDYIIKYGKTSWESSYITLKDFGATKGQIQPGEEIILYSYTENNADDKKILDCVHEAFPDGNWVRVTSSNNDGEGTLSFGGDKTIVLKKADNIIDVIGAIAANGLPTNSAVTSPSWGDAKGWTCETGLSIADDTQIGISTNRCLLIRNNTVTSGENAVTQNIADFVTLCTEWKGAQVPDSDIDNGVAASCENFAYVGTFDYSDYYTKYVPMDGGTSTFDENDRNPDGTVSIYIPDLYKRACSNIRVKLTNSDGEVLTDREYKVPIMITSDQTTAGQAFLELQENLATVEVDDQGNVINTYPLELDEVREICKTCDVVIRDSATLTKAADNDANDHPQVNNVFIYEGASLVIPNGTNETITSLSLRRKGDIVASAKVEEGGNLHLPASATAPIYLDMRIDANNWHWFTLPYNCNIADVTWVDGTPAQYNKDWFIMYYDGNSRANEQSIYENHWKVYNGTTIEAGKGYIVGIQGDITHPDYTFELRFPMTTDVLTNEHIDKTVAVNAWGVNMDITPNKKGWNLVGNPYLDYYKTSENISFTGLSLIEYLGIDPVTGERLYQEGGNVPFLVTPVDGGWYEYQQELASDVEMMPFTAYFVQVGHPNNPDHTDGMELHAEFVSDHRGRMSLIRRTPQEVAGEQEPVIVRVEVANAKGESDKTTLIIDDRFTSDYEMNADFFKWFGDYYRRYTKPVLYSMGADQGKRAFNALSEQLAAQPVALGMFAAQAGDYTFTLTRKRCDLSRVEEVWLYDATTATYTNLMQQDYTFTTAKTEGEGRFYLSVKLRQNAPTDITDIYGGNIVASAKDGQIIVSGLTDNTQLWIYDATGKLLHTEQTTNFQHVYEAPVAGTYFVRTQVAGQAQTIKVLVE